MHHRRIGILLTSFALSPIVARGLAAQSLKGSAEAVEHPYLVARATGLQFYATTRAARRAVAAGEFVPLSGNADYAPKSGMPLPYATTEVRSFVELLGAEYHAACGEQLIVTSALRPISKRPRNGSVMSVHPTGIAVDVRKPKRRMCRDWLRQLLLQHEREGTVDATEEFHPPHFHIVVLQALEHRTTEANVID